MLDLQNVGQRKHDILDKPTQSFVLICPTCHQVSIFASLHTNLNDRRTDGQLHLTQCLATLSQRPRDHIIHELAYIGSIDGGSHDCESFCLDARVSHAEELYNSSALVQS